MFKTKTMHLKTKTKNFLWCILQADWKAFFIFGRKWKCQRKWNSIYGRKRNENRHSFSAEKRKRKSSDNISVFSFSYIQSPIPRPVSPFLQVVLVHGIPLSSCTVYRYLCGIFRSTSKSQPNNIRAGKNVRPYVCTSVRPQKVSSISMKFGI